MDKEIFFLILAETTECDFNDFNIGTVIAIEKKFV